MHSPQIWQQVAHLHANYLDQSFLATLGSRFLALMYRAIDESHGSILLVEKRGADVIGFVTGTHSMGLVYRQMLQYWWHLIPALLPSLFSPRRLWRILEILRYSRKRSAQVDLPAYELLSIVVDPSERGQGVSERLYTGLMSHCCAHNIPAFKIVVGEKLGPAHRLYHRMGAVIVAETEVHRGEKSLVYVQEVRPTL